MNPAIDNACRCTRCGIAATLFFAALLLVGVTLKDYGVTWDEPPYFHATDLHSYWLSGFGKNLLTGELEKSLSDETIKAAWRWNPYHVPHPPFSRILSALTKYLFYPPVDKFSAYRIAPALFFASMVTAMFLWMSELFDRTTGLFSSVLLILTPNLFAYAHIAVTDLPLASLWFITAYCFWKGLENWRWSIAAGVVWGLALATKFPALLIPVPLLIWAHLFHRDRYANNSFALLFLAPLMMIATQPYLWHQTGLRVVDFLYEGLSRGYRPDTNFTIYFYGEKYLTSELPWYYPFFVVGVTTPLPIIALAAIGTGPIAWGRDGLSHLFLFLLNALFVVVLGILPGAVLHDGMRQLLSALPFVVALAGAGFYATTQGLFKAMHPLEGVVITTGLRGKIAVTLFLLVSISPAVNLYLIHPFQLSYYNSLVGGIQGAYKRGLEMTYFMDALTPSFIQQLNKQLPERATVHASFANFMLDYYQKQGRLRSDIRLTKGQPFDYYILLNRRSALPPRENRLLNGSVPPYVSVNVAGVPLVSVFDFKPSK
jgi:hypothetical protein